MPIHSFVKSSTALGLLAFVTNVARADFAPVPLTSDSFNQDIVIEKTGPPPLVPVTTASMEAGTNNTGFSFYEQGYNTSSGATGLPIAGTTTTSDLSSHSYQFAPTYKTNNAILVDSNLPAATLFLSSPPLVAQLSFLVTGANGISTLQYVVHHQNGATQSGSFSCPDWYFGLGPALSVSGRVDVKQFTFDSVNSGRPSLYARDITLVNSNSPVTRVDFSLASGAGEIAVFAISAAANLGDDFLPVTVTGFNRDLVVEATATQRTSISGATTATMEHGTGNTGYTWFEQNYFSPSPASGLPTAGSFLTNTAADHRFLMPASYAANNALVLDASASSAALTPASPVTCSALSFLGSASQGPATNSCIIQHADGISETNSLIMPDWLSGGSPAWIPNGRVNINNRVVDAGAGSPKLFAIDTTVAHSTSPVTNIVLTFNGGNGADSHAVFFALSASAGAAAGPRPVLTIEQLAGGNLKISSSQPGILESTTLLKSSNTIWQTESAISTSVIVSPVTNGPAKLYRVRQ